MEGTLQSRKVMNTKMQREESHIMTWVAINKKKGKNKKRINTGMNWQGKKIP